MGTIAAGAVPVIPNAGLVRGTLKAIMPDPSGRGHQWSISIEEVQDVLGYPNFARQYLGQSIDVFVHAAISVSAKISERLELKITYRSSGVVGRFAVISDHVVKLPP
jgi:hypothetical protein